MRQRHRLHSSRLAHVESNDVRRSGAQSWPGGVLAGADDENDDDNGDGNGDSEDDGDGSGA
jgi:hypothetical protein